MKPYIDELNVLRRRAENNTDPLALQWIVAELCELLAKDADPPLWNETNLTTPSDFVQFVAASKEFKVADQHGVPQTDAMDTMSRTIIEENERLAKENKDLLHQVAVLTAQERTQRQRGDHWHAKWSSYARIMNAIADSMTSSTQRLHALFGDDLSWDELLAAAADELEGMAS